MTTASVWMYCACYFWPKPMALTPGVLAGSFCDFDLKMKAANLITGVVVRSRNFEIEKSMRDQVLPPPETEQFPQLVDRKSDCALEFLKIEGQLNDERYWKVLRWLWIKHGGSVARNSLQPTLFGKRPNRHLLMSPLEISDVDGLPSELTVFHGTGRMAKHFGWSWSLRFESSNNFASKRFSDGPRVVVGRCRKADIIAYFSDYDEAEIVIDPALVQLSSDLVGDDLFDYREKVRRGGGSGT